MKIKLLTLLFLLPLLSVLAQQKSVVTTVDSTRIKIGAQLNLTLKTITPKESAVIFPEQDRFGAFEVLESYPVDTIKKSNQYELIKRYGLTQFDSGRYVIPKLSVVINDKVHFSDSLKIEVVNVAVDTLKQKMYDIRPIIEVDSETNYWWLLLLLLPGIGYLIYFLINKYKNKSKDEEEFFATPIEKATNYLSRLEKKELWQKGEVKSYYIELTEIVRTYIEEAIEVPALENTTSELIDNLKSSIKSKNLNLPNDVLKSLDKLLSSADLVKFAQSKPLEFEIVNDRKNAEKIITSLNSSIPQKEVEQEGDVKIADKKRFSISKKNWVVIIISIISIFYLAIGYSIYNHGFGFLSAIFGGQNSKAILEGDWYTSEYGSPSVTITTPEVLERTVTPDSLKTNLQSFNYGNIFGNLHISVSIMPVQKDTQINLDLAMETIVKQLETQGAHSILVDYDDFETQNGFKGKKAFGSMSLNIPGAESFSRVRYEMLLFSQEGALQQVLVVYKDQDEYAEKVKQKIMNSVELKKVH